VRNRLVRLLAVLFLLISVTAEVRAQDSGVIEGQVLNETLGGTPIRTVPVTLWALDAQGQNVLLEETTDGEGRVAFQALDTEAYSYQLQVVYQGVSYRSEVVAFSQGEELLSVPVTVYESTTSDADLWVERAHLIVDFQADTLLLQELQIFFNAGTKTYVGSDGEGGHTLHFSLPPGATELQLTEDMMACCIERTEGGFAYTEPILPGEKEFFFTYQLPYQVGSHTLSKEAIYPIHNLDVLVADVGLGVTALGLIAQEPVSLQGGRYLHLSAQGFGPGDALTLHIADQSLESRPSEPSMAESTVLVRAIIGLGTLATLLILGYPFFKRRQGEES